MCKNKTITGALLLSTVTAIFSQPLQAAGDYGIQTLFTTPQERALIDNNRYRVMAKKAPTTVTPSTQPKVQKKVQMETLIINVKLNGITLSENGQYVAWLNGKAYENGGKLDDGSQVFIKNQPQGQVQIKTPDGKYHRLVTGENSELQYQKAVEG